MVSPRLPEKKQKTHHMVNSPQNSGSLSRIEIIKEKATKIAEEIIQTRIDNMTEESSSDNNAIDYAQNQITEITKILKRLFTELNLPIEHYGHLHELSHLMLSLASFTDDWYTTIPSLITIEYNYSDIHLALIDAMLLALDKYKEECFFENDAEDQYYHHCKNNNVSNPPSFSEVLARADKLHYELVITTPQALGDQLQKFILQELANNHITKVSIIIDNPTRLKPGYTLGLKKILACCLQYQLPCELSILEKQLSAEVDNLQSLISSIPAHLRPQLKEYSIHAKEFKPAEKTSHALTEQKNHEPTGKKIKQSWAAFSPEHIRLYNLGIMLPKSSASKRRCEKMIQNHRKDSLEEISKPENTDLRHYYNLETDEGLARVGAILSKRKSVKQYGRLFPLREFDDLHKMALQLNLDYFHLLGICKQDSGHYEKFLREKMLEKILNGIKDGSVIIPPLTDIKALPLEEQFRLALHVVESEEHVSLQPAPRK